MFRNETEGETRVSIGLAQKSGESGGQTVGLHLPPERAPADSQQPGGLAGVGAGGLKRLGNGPAFGLGQGNHVLTVAAAKDVEIVALPTLQTVGPQTTDQGVAAAAPLERIGAGAALDGQLRRAGRPGTLNRSGARQADQAWQRRRLPRRQSSVAQR